VAVHSEDFVILACTVLIQITSVTDGRTDRRTDGRPDDGKDARSILLSRVKMSSNYVERFMSYRVKIESKT